MRKVELIYVEVMNETEQLFVFETIFNRQSYAHAIILNTALSIEVQDAELGNLILSLANMTREDAANSEQ
jgi:hypothetical protein